MELFVGSCWEDYLGQHIDRLTGTDRSYQDRAVALAEGDPTTRHYVSVEAAFEVGSEG